MFKIGEFSKLTQVSVRMLRYYDEMKLLPPAHIDNFTGYRMYAPEQMETLHKIIFLRDIGCTVSEIAVALAQWDSDVIIEHLKSKQRQIHTTIKQEQTKLQKIKDALESIGNEKPIVQHSIHI